MKRTLLLKFLAGYLIFAIVSFLFVALYGSRLVTDNLIANQESHLYTEASDMLASYRATDIDLTLEEPNLELLQDLKIMSSCLESDVWIMDQSGSIVLSSSWANLRAPLPTDFNPLDSGSRHYLIGDFYGMFKGERLTVYVPITSNYRVSGYLLVHRSTDDLRLLADEVLKTTYMTLGIVLLLSGIMIFAFFWLVVRPVRKITVAAGEYAHGNLAYKIDVHSADEMGYLAATLNDMASQLEESAENQRKFLANVSHDFRSPLTSIHGYAEAIADGTIPPELSGKYLNVIVNETNRLTKLTQEMLTLNAFDGKGAIMNFTVFNVNEIIKKCAATFEVICRSRGISFRLTFDRQSLMVKADQTKIEQVLYNLIDNAIKFSPDGSTIDIDSVLTRGKAFISVKDHGVGISKENLKKIWDRFYKTDASRGRDKKGTGLGLSIVREIMRAHGESIDVVSTVGAGTKFTFQLKAVPTEDETF